MYTQICSAAHEPLQFVAEFARKTQRSLPYDVCRPYLEQIIRETDGVDMAADALQEAILIRQPRWLANATELWTDFIQRSRSKPAINHDAKRPERLKCKLTALWGQDVLVHYGWDRQGRHFLDALWKCAKQCPSWKGFIAHANPVLLSRHEAYILDKSNNELRPIGQHHPSRSQANLDGMSPLQVQDLRLIQKWANGAPTKAYGIQFFPSKPSKEQGKRVQEWADDQHGLVQINSQPLHTRSTYHQADCIGLDEYGLLVPEPAKYNKRVQPKKRKAKSALEKSKASKRPTPPRPKPPVPITPESSANVEDEDPSEIDISDAQEPVRGTNHEDAVLPGTTSAVNSIVAPLETETEETNLEDESSAQCSYSASSCVLRTAWERVICLADCPEEPMPGVIISEDEPFTDTSMYSILDDYLDLIRECSTDPVVDARYGADPVKSLSLEYFRQLREASENDLALPRTPNNLLNLRPYSGAQRPALLRHPRFRLLDLLIQRCDQIFNPGSGKQSRYNPFDVGSCVQFDILGYGSQDLENCASSPCHIDALVGTWIRPLTGQREWDVIDTRRMTEDDWNDFAQAPNDWDPKDKGVTLELTPNQVLFMMPGHRIIHRVRTTETSLATGGFFWDKRNVLGIMEALLWVCKNPYTTNEEIPQQLPRILAELVNWVYDRASQECWLPEGMSSSTFLAKVDSLHQEFKNLGCTDQHCKSAKTCTCRAAERKCNEWCRCPGKRDVVQNPPRCFGS